MCLQLRLTCRVNVAYSKSNDDIMGLITTQEMMLQLLYIVVCWAPLVTSAKVYILPKAAVFLVVPLWLWNVSLLHIKKKKNQSMGAPLRDCRDAQRK